MSTTALNTKRIFLVGSSSPPQIESLVQSIRKHVSGCTIYSAVDGAETLAKAENDPPHVVVLGEDLAKIPRSKVVQSLLSMRAMEKSAFILLAPIPERDILVDEVAINKVQFIENPKNDQEMARCLARALNFLNNENGPEFRLRFLAPEDQLLREGDVGQTVYMVKRGSLRAYTQANGQEIHLGSIEPGDFVGEMAYINGEPRSASVSALSDCELIEIPSDHLDHVLFRKPGWAKALLKTLSKRVKRGNKTR